MRSQPTQVSYKGFDWSVGVDGPIVTLTAIGFNGGARPRFGVCVYTELVESGEIVEK